MTAVVGFEGSRTRQLKDLSARMGQPKIGFCRAMSTITDDVTHGTYSYSQVVYYLSCYLVVPPALYQHSCEVP